MKTRSVVIIAMPNAMALDIICPSDVFHNANRLHVAGHHDGAKPYDVRVVSANRSLRVKTNSGAIISCEQSIYDIDFHIDTLIIGGFSMSYDWESQPELVSWLQSCSYDIRRICAVCIGAFLLAEAGLLTHKKATTHWQNVQELEDRYKETSVNSDAIFIKDGNIYTSGGASAGIDLALALVEEDYGKDVYLKIARLLVLYSKRPGSQSQFSDLLQQQESVKKPIHELQVWMNSNLRETLTVRKLSERAFMSQRNFARVFLGEIGLTPAKYVENIRIETSKKLLDDSRESIDRIAVQCGFKSVDMMRKIYLKKLKITPSEYRNLFGRF